MGWKVFERLQKVHGYERIDKESYKSFYSMVPNELKQRMDRKGGFDRLLEMCENADIDFTVSRSGDVEHLETNRCEGFYLSKDDVMEGVTVMSPSPSMEREMSPVLRR